MDVDGWPVIIRQLVEVVGYPFALTLYLAIGILLIVLVKEVPLFCFEILADIFVTILPHFEGY